MHFFTHKTSFQAFVIAIYSTFVVDKATDFFSLGYHETALPAKVIKDHDVDFLESTSPAISTSLKLSNTGLPYQKHKHTLKVPLRNLSIHLTTT